MGITGFGTIQACRCIGRVAITSESVDHYLKAVYELSENAERVSTTALAEYLNVASPSVSAMVKRLSQQEPPLLDYESHRGVTLTKEGRRRALRIIRHHRLVETFLCEALGYSWDEVHEEAELLEHYISERLEDRIDTFLGHPEYDPHGAPIPSKDGVIPAVKYQPLHKIAVGAPCTVVRVEHEQMDMRDYLESLGIARDAQVTVTEKAPFEGPLYVRVGTDAKGIVHGIGVNLARQIMVEPLQTG